MTARRWYLVEYDYGRGIEAYSDLERGLKRAEEWKEFSTGINGIEVIAASELERAEEMLRQAVNALEQIEHCEHGFDWRFHARVIRKRIAQYRKGGSDE